MARRVPHSAELHSPARLTTYRQVPGDEFIGDMRVATSDLGRNELQFTLAGPINDTFGYTFAANVDQFDGPDEWVSSDGFELGGQETTYLTGKLTFAPSDKFDGYVRLLYSDIDDEPPIEFFRDPGGAGRVLERDAGHGEPLLAGRFQLQCRRAVRWIPAKS